MQRERHQAGSTLWDEWQGEGYKPVNPDNVVFYTYEHVDIDQEFIRTSLAIALQQSGIMESRSVANRAISFSESYQGWVGTTEDGELMVCDEDGDTYYGDEVENIQAVTWVEVDTYG